MQKQNPTVLILGLANSNERDEYLNSTDHAEVSISQEKQRKANIDIKKLEFFISGGKANKKVKLEVRIILAFGYS